MSDTPDPDEVKRVLKGMGWQEDKPAAAKPAEGEDEDPLSALNIETHEDVNTIPIPEEVLEGLAPPNKDRVRNLAGGVPDTEPAKAVDPWSRTVPELGTVSVTKEELEEYTKALLFDERLELTVGLWMGDTTYQVRCRSLYVSEREVMAFAVAKIAQEYPLKTVSNAAIIGDYCLKAEVLMQITAINGVAQDVYDGRPDDGQLPEQSAKVEELARLARTRFGQTHQAKLRALVRALHIFETKQQILEDAFHNRDFPIPDAAY